MKKAVKILSCVICGIIICGTVFLLCVSINIIGDIPVPSSIVGPCISVITFCIGIILLTRYIVFKDKKSLPRKSLYISIPFIVGAIILYHASMAINEISLQKRSQSQEEYNNLRTSYLEIFEKYNELQSKQFETRDIIFAGVAKTISEDSSVYILSDEAIQVMIPMEDKTIKEILGDIDEYISSFVSALKISDFKTCYVMVVDDNGLTILGVSFNRDGQSSVFVSEKSS